MPRQALEAWGDPVPRIRTEGRGMRSLWKYLELSRVLQPAWALTQGCLHPNVECGCVQPQGPTRATLGPVPPWTWGVWGVWDVWGFRGFWGVWDIWAVWGFWVFWGVRGVWGVWKSIPTV